MPCLAYWKIRGLAQPIRMLLKYVDEDFEDLQYEQGDRPGLSRDAWLSVKPTMAKELDFPNLPYYIDGDVKITQSNAILKHVARKHKLDGESEVEKATVDMLLDTAMDFRNGTTRLCYNADYDNLKEDYFKNVQGQLSSFEKKLGDKPWFAGDKLTVADFPFYELLDQHKRMKSDILDPFPKINAFLARFEALERIKAYHAKDEVKNLPINNKSAAFR